MLQKIGCPPNLLAFLTSFHKDMHKTVCFNGSSEAFPVSSRVKQGCVLAPTLFGSFQYAFDDCIEGVYISTMSDGKIFSTARLRAKTKIKTVLIRGLLSAAAAAAFTSHVENCLQQLVSHLSKACKESGLTTSLKKTLVVAQEALISPSIVINDGHSLEVSHTLVPLFQTHSHLMQN